MLMVGFLAQNSPNFLALPTNTSVSMIASSESPLYQPSIQVSTILISSGLPSTNCLQDIVDRSSTTACAGTDADIIPAASSIAAMNFIGFSPHQKCHSAPQGYHSRRTGGKYLAALTMRRRTAT